MLSKIITKDKSALPKLFTVVSAHILGACINKFRDEYIGRVKLIDSSRKLDDHCNCLKHTTVLIEFEMFSFLL